MEQGNHKIITTVTKFTDNIDIVDIESNGKIMTVLFSCREDGKHLISANKIGDDR